jgi:hypothetical protein
MNRETAQAIWYRQLDPSCFSTSDSATRTPVPAAFANAWKPRGKQRGLTRLRAIFGRS